MLGLKQKIKLLIHDNQNINRRLCSGTGVANKMKEFKILAGHLLTEENYKKLTESPFWKLRQRSESKSLVCSLGDADEIAWILGGQDVTEDLHTKWTELTGSKKSGDVGSSNHNPVKYFSTGIEVKSTCSTGEWEKDEYYVTFPEEHYERTDSYQDVFLKWFIPYGKTEKVFRVSFTLRRKREEDYKDLFSMQELNSFNWEEIIRKVKNTNYYTAGRKITTETVVRN